MLIPVNFLRKSIVTFAKTRNSVPLQAGVPENCQITYKVLKHLIQQIGTSPKSHAKAVFHSIF